MLKAARFGFTDAVSSLLDRFVTEGVVIDSGAVDASVTKTGLGALPKLASYDVDIQKYGTNAFCSAARFDNFEAVSWLLQAGVDINTSIRTRFGTRTIIAYLSLVMDMSSSHKFSSWIERDTTQMGIDMLAYLISHGARLKLNPDDPSSYEFLKEIMMSPICRCSSFLARMKIFLNSVDCPEDLATDQESLLGYWNPDDEFPESIYIRYQMLGVYELLVNRGCPIRRGCQLAFFIKHGAHTALSSIRIKQYPTQAAASRGYRDLLVELLKRGADINQPAIGHGGRTALQSACTWAAQSTQDQTHKLGWIKTLIDLGADVNAPAGKHWGMTALQIAVSYGDMGTALILLKHGANANAPPSKRGYCALDVAAKTGRLDMVQLLLSIAAHSHHRGTTGYDGAIKLAIDFRHYAVAEFIQEHIRNFGNCIIVEFGDSNPVVVPNDSDELSSDDNEDEVGNSASDSENDSD
ncbi:ankyrin repeat-containing domain protein [Xylaria telfairii]|nr:ankyrin repeat-containing domain protein [Xylaria telfairii]